MIDTVKMPTRKLERYIDFWKDYGYDVTVVDKDDGFKELTAVKSRSTALDSKIEFKELIEIDDSPLYPLAKSDDQNCGHYVSPFATFNDTCPSTVIGKFVDSNET